MSLSFKFVLGLSFFPLQLPCDMTGPFVLGNRAARDKNEMF